MQLTSTNLKPKCFALSEAAADLMLFPTLQKTPASNLLILEKCSMSDNLNQILLIVISWDNELKDCQEAQVNTKSRIPVMKCQKEKKQMNESYDALFKEAHVYIRDLDYIRH